MSQRFPAGLRRTLITAVVASCVLGPAVTAPAAGAKTIQLGSRTLRVGMNGSDVKQLQNLLTKSGVQVTADGHFGSGTKTAVQRFQRAANLPVTGTVGVKTVDALRTAVRGVSAQNFKQAGGLSTDGQVKTHSLGDRIPVRQGMSGHDVKVLQDFLKRAGVKHVTIDGEFGAGTLKAVRSFEGVEKLTVDGIVDANDIDVLRGQAGAGPDAAVGAAPLPLAPGDRAKLTEDGLAMAPANAPDAVKAIIAAGNVIAKLPYIYGGGHGKWDDNGYDCSGSVSYALHGAGFLDSALVSGDFPDWGASGPGQWITIYGNSGHVYMVVAGLRYDTSGQKQDGSRWHKAMRPTKGYGVSHPVGL